VDASIPSNDVTVTCAIAMPDKKNRSKLVEIVRAEHNMRELLFDFRRRAKAEPSLRELRTEN
jgi:hypothetical protein